MFISYFIFIVPKAVTHKVCHMQGIVLTISKPIEHFRYKESAGATSPGVPRTVPFRSDDPTLWSSTLCSSLEINQTRQNVTTWLNNTQIQSFIQFIRNYLTFRSSVKYNCIYNNTNWLLVKFYPMKVLCLKFFLLFKILVNSHFDHE